MKKYCPSRSNLPIQYMVVTILAFLYYFQANAQKIRFERIPNELGLSQNFISALCQDRDGFIWAGTKDGLNRFDGYTFKTFTHDPFDSLSISNNYIRARLLHALHQVFNVFRLMLSITID